LFAVGQVFGWLTAERDMANIDIGWEIESSQISPEESVRGMLGVISTKNVQQSGSFWTWDSKVRYTLHNYYQFVLLPHHLHRLLSLLIPPYIYLADGSLGASLLALSFYVVTRRAWMGKYRYS
jgi:hypothetical protein